MAGAAFGGRIPCASFEPARCTQGCPGPPHPPFGAGLNCLRRQDLSTTRPCRPPRYSAAGMNACRSGHVAETPAFPDLLKNLPGPSQPHRTPWETPNLSLSPPTPRQTQTDTNGLHEAVLKIPPCLPPISVPASCGQGMWQPARNRFPCLHKGYILNPGHSYGSWFGLRG